MFTYNDLNNITVYILEQRGPMLPVDIRQVLDRIVREANIPILPVWDSEARNRDRVIDPMLYPPMQEITRQLEEWDIYNPDKAIAAHLFYAGNPQSQENRDHRKEWEKSHNGPEEIIDHEFTIGNSDNLSEEQKDEVDRILNLSGQ